MSEAWGVLITIGVVLSGVGTTALAVVAYEAFSAAMDLKRRVAALEALHGSGK